MSAADDLLGLLAEARAALDSGDLALAGERLRVLEADCAAAVHRGEPLPPSAVAALKLAWEGWFTQLGEANAELNQRVGALRLSAQAGASYRRGPGR